MFEKEAIRHAFEVTIGLDCLIKPAEEFTYEELNDHLQEKADDFQDGAEFGYNKAKEEMQKNGLALQSDMDKTIEQNIALKKELNKANEWHKVADEGLPINKNDGATYLLYTIYGEGGSPVVAHFAYRDKQELMNVWTGAILTEDKIVAWKEIVLPKEIKEND